MESGFLVSRVIELFSNRLYNKSVLKLSHSTMLLALLDVLSDYLQINTQTFGVADRGFEAF